MWGGFLRKEDEQSGSIADMSTRINPAIRTGAGRPLLEKVSSGSPAATQKIIACGTQMPTNKRFHGQISHFAFFPLAVSGLDWHTLKPRKTWFLLENHPWVY